MMERPKKLNRRLVLGGGIAAGQLGLSHVFAQGASAPGVAPPVLNAIVTLGGSTYTYPNGPKIPSYNVGFRPDGRVVFHLGVLGVSNGPATKIKPFHIGAHHVRIEDNGNVLFDADIPAHWWNAKWTFRRRPLAVVKSPSQIVGARRMFPFGDTGEKIAPPHNYTFRGPMDSAGVTKYMPTTGERPDIGLVTDNSAYFMLGANPAPMLAWAQANDSFPFHYRDESTGRPVDLLKYPQANCYESPAQGSPWFDRYPRDAQGNNIVGDGMVPQQAHFCEMAYVAFMATGDLGFLENAQYNANFMILCDAAKSTPRKAILSGELRGIAWGFRNLFMAHVATQDAESRGTLPDSCHPSSYWKMLLDNQLGYYNIFKNDPSNQYYRLVSGGSRFAPWQVDYMLTALAFGVLTGHSDWTTLYLWALKNVIDRTSGKSGYPVGWGGAYYLNTCEWRVDGQGKLNTDQYDTSKPLNWYSSFLYLQKDTSSTVPTAEQISALKSDPFNGGRAITGHEYLLTTRAALIMASYLEKIGLVGVRTMYPELDNCIGNVERMVRADGGMNARTSVVT